MLTAEAKMKRVATAQTRLDRLNDEKAALIAKVAKVDREIRVTTLDLEYRKAAPTDADADRVYPPAAITVVEHPSNP